MQISDDGWGPSRLANIIESSHQGVSAIRDDDLAFAIEHVSVLLKYTRALGQKYSLFAEDLCRELSMLQGFQSSRSWKTVAAGRMDG